MKYAISYQEICRSHIGKYRDSPVSVFSLFHISLLPPPSLSLYWQIYPPTEHRCLEYCYIKLGRSTPTTQLSIDALNTATPNLADVPLQVIKHRCLEYHYTNLCRSSDTEGVLCERPFTHKGDYLIYHLYVINSICTVEIHVCV